MAVPAVPAVAPVGRCMRTDGRLKQAQEEMAGRADRAAQIPGAMYRGPVVVGKEAQRGRSVLTTTDTGPEEAAAAGTKTGPTPAVLGALVRQVQAGLGQE